MDLSTATAPDRFETAHLFAAAPIDLAFHRSRVFGEWVIEMEIGFEGQLDERLVEQAADLLLDAEPLLGCQLVVDAPQPCWQRVARTDRHVLTVTAAAEEYDGVRLTGLDATRGVQMALCLWRSKEGDRLLIKMTHSVGDGVALKLLVSRLSTIYSALCADPAHVPSPTRETARDFNQILSQVPRRLYPRIILDFARFMAPRLLPRRTHMLPVPPESVRPWAAVVRRVPAARVSFLSQYGKTRGATLNDVFLAAAYRALAASGPWDGTSGLRIVISVDLRRWCLPSNHVATICNLSSVDCPFLIRNLGGDFEETLANVAALMRRRKNGWPGLAVALLGYCFMKKNHGSLGHEDAQNVKVALSKWARRGRPLTLSNEGALDTIRLRFGQHSPVSAHILPPFLELPGVHVCLSGYKGALTIAAVTPQNGKAIVGRFLDALIDELP